MFNPVTVQFKRIPRVNCECEKGGLKGSPIKDYFGFGKQSGESDTSLDPGSRTRRKTNSLCENLQSNPNPKCNYGTSETQIKTLKDGAYFC